MDTIRNVISHAFAVVLRYVFDINPEDLEVSLWRGELLLRNVFVRPHIVEMLGLDLLESVQPYAIDRVKIECFRLCFSWRRVMALVTAQAPTNEESDNDDGITSSSSFKLYISGVHITIVRKNERSRHTEQQKHEQQQHQQHQGDPTFASNEAYLSDLDNVLNDLEMANRRAESSSSSKLVERLRRAVMFSAFEIKNVCLCVFDDYDLDDHSPLLIKCSMAELSGQFRPTLSSTTDNGVSAKLSLAGVGVQIAPVDIDETKNNNNILIAGPVQVEVHKEAVVPSSSSSSTSSSWRLFLYGTVKSSVSLQFDSSRILTQLDRIQKALDEMEWYQRKRVFAAFNSSNGHDKNGNGRRCLKDVARCVLRAQYHRKREMKFAAKKTSQHVVPTDLTIGFALLDDDFIRLSQLKRNRQGLSDSDEAYLRLLIGAMPRSRLLSLYLTSRLSSSASSTTTSSGDGDIIPHIMFIRGRSSTVQLDLTIKQNIVLRLDFDDKNASRLDIGNGVSIRLKSRAFVDETNMEVHIPSILVGLFSSASAASSLEGTHHEGADALIQLNSISFLDSQLSSPSSSSSLQIERVRVRAIRPEATMHIVTNSCIPLLSKLKQQQQQQSDERLCRMEALDAFLKCHYSSPSNTSSILPQTSIELSVKEVEVYVYPLEHVLVVNNITSSAQRSHQVASVLEIQSITFGQVLTIGPIVCTDTVLHRKRSAIRTKRAISPPSDGNEENEGLTLSVDRFGVVLTFSEIAALHSAVKHWQSLVPTSSLSSSSQGSEENASTVTSVFGSCPIRLEVAKCNVVLVDGMNDDDDDDD
eukprot:PhM_4_TR3032/c1_g1_i3/m.93617